MPDDSIQNSENYASVPGLAQNQHRILEWLSSLDPNLAAMYSGAIALLSARSPGSEIFICHAAREIMNNLPNATIGVNFGKFNYTTRVNDLCAQYPLVDLPSINQLFLDLIEHNQTRDRLFEEWAHSERDNPLGADLYRKQWKQVLEWFLSKVHLPRNDKRGTPVSITEVSERFRQLEEFLHARAAQFFDSIGEIDVLLGRQPAANCIPTLTAMLIDLQRTRYFFERANASWIEILNDNGFFSMPKDLADSAWGSWPQGKYLANTAAEHPDLVRDILAKLPRVKSPYIAEDIMEAILRLPTSHSAKLIKLPLNLLEDSPHYRLPEYVIRLGMNFLDANQYGLAFNLCDKLLYIKTEFVAGDEQTQKKIRCRSLLQEWSYEKTLSTFMPLVMAVRPKEILEMLLKRLQVALKDNTRDGLMDSNQEFTRFWRQDLRAETRGRSLKHILINSIAKSAGEIAASNSMTLPELISVFSKHEGSIFRRFEIHCALLFQFQPITSSFLTNEQNFENDELQKEYRELLKRFFSDLKSDEKANILERIKAGPSRKDFEESYKHWHERDATKQDWDRHLRLWQYSWYRVLASQLPEREEKRLEELGQEFKVPHELVHNEDDTEWTMQTAEITEKQFGTLSPQECILRLSDYANASKGIQHLIANEFEKAVSERGDEFASNAESFGTLPEQFLSAFISGLTKSIGKQSGLKTWTPVLGLLQYVLSDETFNQEFEVVRATMDLITAGLNGKKSSITADQALTVWEIVKMGLTLPYVQPFVTMDHGSSYNYLLYARTSTTGAAAGAAIDYALWLSGLDTVPESLQVEVRRILSATLVERRAQCVAIFAAELPSLVYLDPAWCIKHADSLLQVFDGEVLDPSWISYISSCSQPYDQVYSIFQKQYHEAAGKSDKIKQLLSDGNRPVVALAKHLVIFSLHGKIDIRDDSNILLVQWRSLDSEERSEVIETVGEWSEQIERANFDKYEPRFRDFWQFCLTHRIDGEELAAFGRWYLSGRFDKRWSLEQLLQAARTAKHVEPIRLSNEVFEQLTVDASVEPIAVLRCVQYLVQFDKISWTCPDWKKHIRNILRKCTSDQNPAAELLVRKLANDLGSLGHFDFRDFASG